VTTNRPKPEQTKLTICVSHPFSQWRAQPAMARAIQSRWPTMRVVHLTDYKELPSELPDTDIFVGASLRPEQFRAAKQLKWIHATAAGVSQLMYPELRGSHVIVTNASGIFSSVMAEHAMGMMIALARNFPDAVRYQEQAHWAQQDLWDKPQHLTELNATTLLIVGFGSIGREIAKRARAFDMRVIGVTRSGKGDAALADRIVPISSLNDVLIAADYVVLCAPETESTKHLIGSEQIGRMKRGARLLNFGRGSILDEAALMAALESGQLIGAALDVAETEPLPATSPLWKARNLFITPHVSGISDRMWTRQSDLFLRLLDEWFEGRELPNRVDLTRGY